MQRAAGWIRLFFYVEYCCGMDCFTNWRSVIMLWMLVLHGGGTS